MRFDTPVYFQTVETGDYDELTGNYAADVVGEVKCYASVTNSGADTLRLVYGEIKQGSLTIRLQNHFNDPFSRIRIGDKLYTVDMERRLYTKHVFVISEVQ